MTLQRHTISSEIAPWVEAIFHLKDFTPDHSIERVVPTGHIFMIFELDGMTRYTYDNDSLKPNNSFTKVWISGMHKHYISISAHPNSEMLVIQFKGLGAYPFLHFPIASINEKVVPAEDILGKAVLALREKLKISESTSDKFTIAEEWLMSRLDEALIPPKDLINVYQKLQYEPAMNYTEVMAEFPQSQKHLIHLFKKYIGLTPKYYQRILRFNEILHHIQQEKPLSWAQIAYQSGYADQSHFIKEFKHFSGFNPSSFINEHFPLEEPNFFPLDREG